MVGESKPTAEVLLKAKISRLEAKESRLEARRREEIQTMRRAIQHLEGENAYKKSPNDSTETWLKSRAR
jgi:hypothetical protein